MTPAQRLYRNACRASHRASEARRDLPPGSTRARVTSANARWMSAAENRDLLGRELTVAERAEVDALIAAEVA